MIETKPALIPPRYWGYVSLALWAIVTLLLLRHSPYVLDEGGAKALLLDWSIGDQVASSVVTLGLPDMRVILWLPLGFLWPGQIMAAKVTLIAVLAWTAYGLYAWRRQVGSEEVALLGTGLLLIAPVSLQQVDTLSPGILLLAIFTAGFWMDRTYRAAPRPFGGLYFAQLVFCAFAVSLHPAGIAYPLSLAWAWRANPVDRNQQRYFYVGIALVSCLALLLRWGWHDLGAWQNPLRQAATWITSIDLESVELDTGEWAVGVVLTGLVVMLLIWQRRMYWNDLLGRSLWWGVVLGALQCDASWGFLAVALLCYGGFEWLLKPREVIAGKGFFLQRGWVLFLLLILSTFFMRGDRAWYEQGKGQVMTAQDQIIRQFADDVDRTRVAAEEKRLPMPRVRVASQWPARTMIACRCDALPLPPAAKDPETQLTIMRGLTHLIFVPNEQKNIGLVQNLSQLGTEIQTVSLQPGGVILKVRSPVLAPLPAMPAVPPVPASSSGSH
ncbi:MAG: hypothetical protein KGM83_02605 [Betaproteobacteria bacterium]|nr:hypothetical protein [Betaproteobacteria bacterium]